MNRYIYFIFILTTNLYFAQSKKEQIETLTIKIDSLLNNIDSLNKIIKTSNIKYDSLFRLMSNNQINNNQIIKQLSNNNYILKKEIDSLNKLSVYSIEREMENWKSELYINKEVGPKCTENYEKWTIDNPDYYWGISDFFKSDFDFNSDGIKDALIYFPAQNCVAGSGHQSNFAMLVYSHKNSFLTNKKITNLIEGKITSKLNYEEKINSVYKIELEYLGLTQNINGNFSGYIEQDANCCPSYSGKFIFNPLTYEVEINFSKN